MYVKITDQRGAGARTTYHDLSKLTYSPEIDVTCSAMPISELSVTILTTDTISVGSIVELYDDMDNRWCAMPVIYAEMDDERHTTVRGKSVLARLEACEMQAKMYDTYAWDVVQECFNAVLRETGVIWPVHMDSEVATIPIKGYCPKQNARTRLQWILMVTGSTISDWHLDRNAGEDVTYGDGSMEAIADYIYIRPIDDENVKYIPIESTYWRPKVTYKDFVTAIKVTVYEYEHRAPSRTEEYVEIKQSDSDRTGDIWTQTSVVATLTNTAVPADAYENIVELDGITLINDENVDDVLTHLAKFHFTRDQVEMDVIDNFEWLPADRVIGFLSQHQLFTGYLNSCVFTFGKQAKASMLLTPAEPKEGAVISIIYTWNDMTVAKRSYTLPVGYDWTMPTEYVEIDFAGHHYVLMPSIPSYTVPVAAGGTTLTVPMQVAIDRYEDSAYVRSVDRADTGQHSVSLTVSGRRS